MPPPKDDSPITRERDPAIDALPEDYGEDDERGGEIVVYDNQKPSPQELQLVRAIIARAHKKAYRHDKNIIGKKAE